MRTVLLLVGLALGLALAQQTARSQPAAVPPEVRISIAATDAPTVFRVTMTNAADRPLTFNLGVVLGYGQEYVNEVRYDLTDAHGRTLHLTLMDPMYVAGSISPLLVSLPVGASYSLPIRSKAKWRFAAQGLVSFACAGSVQAYGDFYGGRCPLTLAVEAIRDPALDGYSNVRAASFSDRKVMA